MIKILKKHYIILKVGFKKKIPLEAIDDVYKCTTKTI